VQVQTLFCVCVCLCVVFFAVKRDVVCIGLYIYILQSKVLVYFPITKKVLYIERRVL